MKRINSVYAVGVNDAEYKTQIMNIIDGKRVNVWTCQIYRTWKNMLRRCYDHKYLAERPSYQGCSVHSDWLRFSSFRNWMICQPWNDSQLDKDILVPGNKVYGPDACVFVSSQLNSFLVDCASSRGDWPLGVSVNKRKSKFVAMCCNPFSGKYENLGYFSDSGAAHQAWRARKHQHALRYADMQTDSRIAEALRKRFAP